MSPPCTIRLKDPRGLDYIALRKSYKFDLQIIVSYHKILYQKIFHQIVNIAFERK